MITYLLACYLVGDATARPVCTRTRVESPEICQKLVKNEREMLNTEVVRVNGGLNPYYRCLKIHVR